MYNECSNTNFVGNKVINLVYNNKLKNGEKALAYLQENYSVKE
ncbi:hypothetical protein [Clostridium fallax]|nr:hypothetical protein [Clostridium fallax]